MKEYLLKWNFVTAVSKVSSTTWHILIHECICGFLRADHLFAGYGAGPRLQISARGQLCYEHLRLGFNNLYSTFSVVTNAPTAGTVSDS